ncbi:zinc finger protein 239-like [Hyposmocoma kahamanoa]|uniref:zinc finger protein 239-like n=1 Tax=Hyposmocoma kahamanoa TaxID=1477025 RepID=UPI000E6D75AE|nr:zinc finger protein 239-like [Hyposmocoma kahamanoa]
MSVTKVHIYPCDGLPDNICNNCLEKLEICTEFIQLFQDSDQKLRTSVEIVEGRTNFNVGDISETNNEFSDYPIRNIKNEVLNALKQKCIDEVENIHLTNVNERQQKIKEKYQCSICGKLMASGFTLKNHIRIHTGEKPFLCTHCDKSFASLQALKVHLRTHTGIKPYKCKDCDLTFAHAAGLKAHARKHSGSVPYRCTLCSRAFRHSGQLQYHLLRHRGELNFKCDNCHGKFISKFELKRHLLTHGGKPATCHLCGLQLSRQAHVKRHIQAVHEGVKPFSCTGCSAKFAQKCDLDKHKIKRHIKRNLSNKFTPNKI